ncbi:MAG: CRISPR-associated endonuclease Cas2 [Vicinamibacterales bacterium]
MSDTKWWLVCYDIRDDKRLRLCAKHMEGYGLRLQYSVFRCWMTTVEVERLRWELTEMLDPADDVLLMPLCQRCVSDIVGIHGDDRPIDWPNRPPRHNIV